MKKIFKKISGWTIASLLIFVILLAGTDSGISTGHEYSNLSNNDAIDGDLIVWLKKDISINSLIASQPDITIYSMTLISKELNIWLLKYDNSEGDSPSALLSSLNSDQNVLVAQQNHRVTLRENAPDDPGFSDQWSLSNTGQLGGTPNADIKALKAWDITTGGYTKDGKEIVVAVIDDGFFLEHSDLTFWNNKNEIPNNNIDDDENGYIDDYYGWNAAENNGTIIPKDHGTRVCGVIGAKGNNLSGIAGVNWMVSLMPIVIDAVPEIDEATVLKAYAYVYKQRQLYNQSKGAKGSYVVAANSSFGLDFEQPENHPIWCEFYNIMGHEGIINVAATMNNNSNVDVTGDIPTSCSSNYLITVTSTTRTDERYNNSAYGPVSVDIGAPGVSILSTYSINQYGSAGGTSLAAPHVTGLVALIYAAANESYIDYGMEYPDSLALLFKKFILKSSDKLPSLQGLISSDGRLNLFNTLKQVERPMGFNNYIPVAYKLDQNYPNPFNPSTSIIYDVLDAVNVQITIYNSLGQKVATPVNGFHTKGRYTVNFDASSLSAGVYFYQIQSKYFSDAKKMILLK